MNRSELISAVRERVHSLSLSKKEVDAVVGAVLDVVVDTVAAKEKVNITGFGCFEHRERKAREGRNPATNEPLSIPAKTFPAFSPGKTFKEVVAAG